MSPAANVPPSLIVDVVAESIKHFANAPNAIGPAVVPYTPLVTVNWLVAVSIPEASIEIISVPVVDALVEIINLALSARPVFLETLTVVEPLATSGPEANIDPVSVSILRSTEVKEEVPPVTVSPTAGIPTRLALSTVVE